MISPCTEVSQGLLTYIYNAINLVAVENVSVGVGRCSAVLAGTEKYPGARTEERGKASRQDRDAMPPPEPLPHEDRDGGGWQSRAETAFSERGWHRYHCHSRTLMIAWMHAL